MSDAREVVTVTPTTFPKANAFVSKHHRHHAALPGGFAWFCVQAVIGGRVVAVAIAGRPTNRNNDCGQTVEVLRLASDGSPNACSALLGACARAAKAIGARRIITYTLTSEPGKSLRGAGWVLESDNTGRSFWGNGNTRTPAVERKHMAEGKMRWALTFREAVVVKPETLTEVPAAARLFDVEVR